ncbi:6-phosphogluconate dehydrogenase [Apodospora peruviana]|uniref:6-phosphogluconate dehydrogenase n=1 Tax=Apodospora peruviana TaxID=516989 RepID=A0AAE0MFC3_9PEZI|nr:6-phosphogluconate dehydrogenase [Apodospora peruviana]
MATSNPPPGTARATIGIISMGDMGSGLARLVVANGYAVATNYTIDRALAAGVELTPNDQILISQCDVILSVVPPRDAIATANRIIDGLKGADRSHPLYFADMNAVSPATCQTIAELFATTGDGTTEAARFIDGSILGGPPAPPHSLSSSSAEEWTRPLLSTSGPHNLYAISDLGGHPVSEYGAHLASVLRIKHISETIGAASGLKMCFASLSKGFAAVAVQAVTTAHRLGVLDDLKDSLATLAPANLERMEKAVVGMSPKAYRWVREMEEISATHEVDGGFEGEKIFAGAADVFRIVAEDTVLGNEKPAVPGLGVAGGKKRVRGTTSEDVARCMAEGLENKKRRRVDEEQDDVR